MYAVIMAGGVGTRLWPLSRQARPKQFHALVGRRTLLQDTFDRLQKVAAPQRIFVCTVARYLDLCREQLPEVPADHFLIEPVGRNTGPAIGLAAACLAREDPHAVLVSVASDHVVTRPERFAGALRAARAALQEYPDHLCTVGLTPSSPETGYGYIEQGDRVGEWEGEAVHRVARFVEKPDPATAERYLSSGRFLWNASYFIFRVETMMAAYRRHLPDLHALLLRLQEAWRTPAWERALEEVYARMPPIAVDDGIFEPEEKVLVVPSRMGWSDVGTWASLHEVLKALEGAEVVARGPHLGLEDRESLVIGGDRLVVTLGVEGLIIVDTPDALLVCARERTQEVKQVVDRLQAADRNELL